MSGRTESIKTYERAPMPDETAWDRKSYNPYVHLKRFIYEHARYTWFDKLTSFILFDRVTNIRNGLTNLWQWIPTIWSDRNWDEYYILKVLQRKIEIQRDYLVYNNRHVNIELDNRDMTIVLNLLERVINDFYEMEHYDYFDWDHWFEKAGEHNGEDTFTWETQILDERFDDFLAKYGLSLKHVLRDPAYKKPSTVTLSGESRDKTVDEFTAEEKRELCRRVAAHNHAKARRILFKILHDRGERWWD